MPNIAHPITTCSNKVKNHRINAKEKRKSERITLVNHIDQLKSVWRQARLKRGRKEANSRDGIFARVLICFGPQFRPRAGASGEGDGSN